VAAAAALYEPAAHEVQLAEPVFVAKVPARQPVQASESAAENLPARQLVHLAELAAA